MPKLTFRIRGVDEETPGTSLTRPVRQTVEVARGTSILDAAYSCGVLIPTQCGGFAKCHACQVFVSPEFARALTPVAADERRLMQTQNATAGMRLACQAQVLADVLVEIDFSTLQPET